MFVKAIIRSALKENIVENMSCLSLTHLHHTAQAFNDSTEVIHIRRSPYICWASMFDCCLSLGAKQQ